MEIVGLLLENQNAYAIFFFLTSDIFYIKEEGRWA